MRLTSLQFIQPLLIIFILAACATIQPVIPAQEGPAIRKYIKNYNIGETLTCYVGEPVVKMVDYYARRVGTHKLKATNDFIVTGGPLLYKESIAGSKGSTYQILGTTMHGGEEHYVINFGGNPNLRHFIKKSGRFSGEACDAGGYMRSPPHYHIDPSTTLLLRFNEEEIVTNRGYINFELVYTGKTQDSIKILYREYTSEDLAKPAFYQELTYSDDAKIIRFRKFRIAIETADNEKLIYKILDDGL